MFKKLALLLEPETQAGSTTAPSAPTSEAASVVAPVVEAPKEDLAGGTPPVDWAAESAAVDGEESPETPPTEVKSAEVKPVEPAAAPVVVAPAAPVKPAEAPVAVKPAEPAAVVKPAEPAVAAQPPVQTEAERKAAAETARVEEEKLFNGLVEYYKLPEDMSLRLSTEPESVLPYLAAKVHQTIAQALARTIHEALPRAVLGVQTGLQMEEKAKNAFYSKWPNLVGKEKEVLQVGVLFRQLNPTATPDEAIARIGKTVCDTLGIAVTAAAPGAPAAPVTPAPVVFTPAGGAGGGRGALPAADNLFTALADELMHED